ncbi:MULTISPECIES: undecaprenyl-diphosphatase [Legionella]|uniref:undecaprenyl-diphosphate phosphatase n=1 Tax=Legionella maceachernii TaxID=466 RepID=A0A0W0VX04_9GAMM|nr:undecaprenyl-diphosphatase [Legionella maceachernii]KTD24600.1 putative undecaprenyl-diphosphatase YbjG [Legionella maceachernii]SKA25374.1 undecaprenyl-diphosphatase [Legionella maceachernii]SUO99413.1 Putative undecaprenyl-diphosphatase ybjG [Legionella maceachernii]
MEQLNRDWFAAINAGADLHGYALGLAIFTAKYLTYLVVLGLAVLWLRGEAKHRNTLLLALSGCFIALVINWIIGLIWYHPRPFVLGIGHTYLNHAPDSSFPSDHTTALCVISFIFLWRETARSVIGLVLLAVALCTAWARIYVGVHYPFDILGSMIVALFSTILMTYLAPLLEKHVVPIPEQIHRCLFQSHAKKG